MKRLNAELVSIEGTHLAFRLLALYQDPSISIAEGSELRQRPSLNLFESALGNAATRWKLRENGETDYIKWRHYILRTLCLCVRRILLN